MIDTQFCEKILRRLDDGARLLEITPLVPEASARRYYRVLYQSGNVSHVHSKVICLDEKLKDTEQAYPFLKVQNYLHSHGIAVPEIYLIDYENSALVQEDLGNISLNTFVNNKPELAMAMYEKALDLMYKFQNLPHDDQVPSFALFFDREKLLSELEFFFHHGLIRFLRHNITPREKSSLFDEFGKICEHLANYEPKVWCHRDYHSRNLMIHNDQLYLIDFQDARMGTPAYDAVSLIFDPYVSLDIEFRNSLAKAAYQKLQAFGPRSEPEYMRMFYLSAAQRILKACGTYAWQAVDHNRADYARNFATAVTLFFQVSKSHPVLAPLASLLVPYLK